MNEEIRKDTDKLERLLDETLQRFKEYDECFIIFVVQKIFNYVIYLI